MLTILLGLLGLSAVVVVHEFGHFLAARAVGVEVEVFSIGWGPKLFGFKRKGTEWRVSAFPIGGYCRMKGEQDFRKAMEEKLDRIPSTPGSFYHATPFRRIIVLLSGPIANVVFAIILFSLVSLVGITIQTAPNRIILASEIETPLVSTSLPHQAEPGNPADIGGLMSGDEVISIDKKAVRDYSDIQESVALNPGKPLLFTVRRDGGTHDLLVTPRLDKSSGQGLIGIYAWIEPEVASIDPDSPAAIAGILPGDRIVSANGHSIRATIDLVQATSSRPELLTLSVNRNGKEDSATLVVSYAEGSRIDLGLNFKVLTRLDRADSLGQAFTAGASETSKTFLLTVKGIGLLFSGVDVFKAVSGPARITYMVGNTAAESIKSSGLSGIPTILSFLAFLSVGLFIMNLLPIPALDGGQIVISVMEIARRKPLHVRTLYRYQFIGSAMVLALFFLATFSDLLFFAGK